MVVKTATGKAASAKKKELFTITGVNHVVLLTSDMDKTLQFYCGILGMKVKANTSRKVHTKGVMAVTKGYERLYFLDLPDGGMLAFGEVKGQDARAFPSLSSALWPTPATVAEMPTKMDHLAFNVNSLAELQALREKFVACGIPCSPIQQLESSPFVCSIYMYDPNGIPIEFATWDLGNKERWARLANEPWYRDPEPVPSMRRMDG